jgi:DNA-binding CsgD family transcriptional regulator
LALITLTASGRVVQANARGESLLRRERGLRLQHGHLHGCSADAQAALHGAIRTVARSGKPQHLKLPNAGDSSVAAMTLMRAPTGTDHGTGLRLVCIVSEGRARIATAAQLIEWLGLTPAEARLVRALADAADLDVYALEAGITRNTVRTHLVHAMAKIGVADQRELIRRVLRLPAVRDR